MLYFMSPPSVGCGAARPLPCSTGPCLPLSLFPARQPCQHRTAEDGPCQQRAVCGKICLAADGHQPHHRVQAHRHRQALVRSMVDFANKADLKSCLEGVEDEKLQNYLRSFGATWFQGYYYSRPVQAAAMQKLLNMEN